jgi:FMNH2-dependent dimethyl sulfone monooxygenase
MEPFRKFGRNKLSIGLFGSNCDGGLACSTFPERWKATWENCRELGVRADAAGLDFMLPLGRWIGYGGETNHNGSNFETITWACGILAATKRIMAFGTVHVTAFAPAVVAKQMVTADHIGGGRFGLNIVCGWYQKEFDMLGVDLGDHERRYDLGQEWIDLVSRIWTADEPFDFDGEFFRTRGTVLNPKPVSGVRPMVACAGTSGRGREYAVKNADMLFHTFYDFDRFREDCASLRAEGEKIGRDVGVFTNIGIVCRPTQKEAEEYHHYYAVEHADTEACRIMMRERGIDSGEISEEQRRRFYLRAATANGATPVVGDPDSVADQLARISEAGADAVAVGLPNYLEDLPILVDEVLPRLEARGLRVSAG